MPVPAPAPPTPPPPGQAPRQSATAFRGTTFDGNWVLLSPHADFVSAWLQGFVILDGIAKLGDGGVERLEQSTEGGAVMLRQGELVVGPRGSGL